MSTSISPRNTIKAVRNALSKQGYRAILSPSGELTYSNFFNPTFHCTDGSKMLALFENELGFPIVSEDPEAHHYFKTQLPVYALDRNNCHSSVQSWIYGDNGGVALLFENNEAVYKSLTKLEHCNHYKTTVPVTSPNAFAKACKKLAKNGVDALTVAECVRQLTHQQYISFDSLQDQFDDYVTAHGGGVWWRSRINLIT